MSDVFADLFGERARAARGAHGVRMRGPDRHYTLEVGFLEAAQGATRRITLPDGGAGREDPRRIRDGQTLRLRGKGGEGSAAARPATPWSRWAWRRMLLHPRG